MVRLNRRGLILTKRNQMLLYKVASPNPKIIRSAYWIEVIHLYRNELRGNFAMLYFFHVFDDISISK